jgi:hypothetical protein
MCGRDGAGVLSQFRERLPLALHFFAMPRTGRPRTHDANAVLDYAHLLIPEQAAALGISAGTVKRMWGRLKADGTIAPDDPRVPRKGRQKR